MKYTKTFEEFLTSIDERRFPDVEKLIIDMDSSGHLYSAETLADLVVQALKVKSGLRKAPDHRDQILNIIVTQEGGSVIKQVENMVDAIKESEVNERVQRTGLLSDDETSYVEAKGGGAFVFHQFTSGTNEPNFVSISKGIAKDIIKLLEIIK